VGDILAQKLFRTATDETHETLDLKTQIASRQLAGRVASELDALWGQAKPQGPGTYTPYFTEAQRTLNFNDSAQTLERQIRAFGRWEVLARVDKAWLHVHRAQCWTELHSVPPGTLVHSDGQRFVVACSDGFVALLEWHLMGADIRTGTPIR
ncbi:MAG: formyl transferase, partial [Paucibacter sp.]|nr:formyl transferase [Roseateles sp.]